MGGVIFIGLVISAILVLLSPAMRERARRSRDEISDAAAEAVVKRLEDRSSSPPPGDGPPKAE